MINRAECVQYSSFWPVWLALVFCQRFVPSLCVVILNRYIRSSGRKRLSDATVTVDTNKHVLWYDGRTNIYNWIFVFVSVSHSTVYNGSLRFLNTKDSCNKARRTVVWQRNYHPDCNRVSILRELYALDNDNCRLFGTSFWHSSTHTGSIPGFIPLRAVWLPLARTAQIWYDNKALTNLLECWSGLGLDGVQWVYSGCMIADAMADASISTTRTTHRETRTSPLSLDLREVRSGEGYSSR